MDPRDVWTPIRDAAVLRRVGGYASKTRTRARAAALSRRRGTVPGMLSLIVPVYNVEKYLDECLVSLRSQAYADVEIVVVDDGSPDRSVEIARRHRLRDPRIRIVRRPNGGLSAARNTGVAAARGEFIAFADSDDTVPPGGYRAAVESLKESGSDFAVLPYQRLKGELITPAAGWIRDAHSRQRTGIAIDDFPGIQVNAIMCSKVFRRDFWLDRGLSFVEGIIYEDQQVSAEAYTRAKAFDVLTEPIYNWRARMDRTSISQNKKEAANLRSQFAAARASLNVLRTYGSPRVVDERIIQLLSNDMGLFASLVVGADDAFWDVLHDELPQLIDQLDPDLYVASIPAQQKVLYHLIATGQRAAAERLVESGGLTLRAVRLGEEEVGRVAYLSAWKDPDVEVPERFFVLSTSQTRPRCSLRAVTATTPTQVRVDAWAFIQNVDLAQDQQEVRAVAHAPGQDPVELTVEQYTDPEIDELAGVGGSGYCDYRPGGVRVFLDLDRLAAGTWEVELTLHAGSVTRSVSLGRPWVSGTGSLRHGLSAGPGRAAVVTHREKRLQVRVYDEDVAAEQVDLEGGVLRLAGRGPRPTALTGRRRGGRPVPARVGDGPDGAWTAVLDLAGEHDDVPAGSPTSWTFLATVGDRQEVPVRLAPAQLRPADADSVVDWRALPGHQDQLVVRTWQAGAQVVDAHVEDDAVVLVVETFGIDLDAYDVCFESRPATSAAVVERDGTILTCRFPYREERWGRPDQVVVSGVYTPVFVERGTGLTITPRVSAALTERLPVDVLLPLLRVRLHLRAVDAGALAVTIAPPLELDERGFRNQLLLQERANNGSGSERSVFFRTLYGEAANDNALAIHEELRRRGSDLTLHWAVRDHSVPLPEGAVPVVEESRAWHEALGDAGYVVLNVHQPIWYDKPDPQVMVETFHGYPYKGMGQTWWDRSGLGASRIAAFLDRAAAWDFLVSPASYATPHLLAEFFTPEAAAKVRVLEVGYPRNDILVRPEGDEVRRRVREALGIDPGQKAVLYAPTFRDYLSNDGMTAKSGDFFDAPKAAQLLGPEYVVLQRGHAFNARANEARVVDERVIDVTYYPDIAELCLASDAAILDYSSLRFDYALTRKPMVFLVPDKELYHALRPAIMDYDPTAPGPHVRSTDEAVAALRDLDGLRTSQHDAVETFISGYMELEDGHAAARVVDEVFTTPGGKA